MCVISHDAACSSIFPLLLQLLTDGGHFDETNPIHVYVNF